MKRKSEPLYYNFKRNGFFSFWKSMIKFLLIIYVIFFVIFFFLEKGVTELTLIIPLIPVTGLFLISILQIIYHLIFSPPEITLTENTINWKTNRKKHIIINLSDISYVKNSLSHSRFNGTYYNNRYTIFLKDGKKYLIDCFMFSDIYTIDKTLIDTTKTYNENIIKYLRKNTGNFLKTYNEEKYTFYTARHKLKFLLGMTLFFLSVFLFIYKIFFIGMIFAAFSVFLIAWPVKIILDIRNKNIIFKNIFGYKTSHISSDKIKKLVINNKFNVVFSVKPNDPKQKYRNFSLEPYNGSDKKKIFKILCLIFENKIEFNFDGKEPLF